MVEIPVERKSHLKWLWLLLGLIILAFLLWWATGDDRAEIERDVAPATNVEAGMEPDASLGPATGADAAAGATAASIPAILQNPSAFVGRNDFAGEVEVPEVPTDRGFWVQQNGGRMFALIIDVPREVPLDINSGQRLRVSKGMLRDTGSIGSIPGEPLDADTKKILADQSIFLVVDEDNIEILSRTGA